MNTPPLLYKLHISLLEVEPAIWRRVVIPVKWRLNKISWSLLIAMGWNISHLYEIEHRKTLYVPDPEECDGMDDEFTIVKDTKMRLGELELKPGDSFILRYDFGDGWEHKITMEGPAEIPAHHKLPRADCLEGARACPPDDCGGSIGYEDLLLSLKDKAHPEHKEKSEWLGKPFDSEFFDLNKTRNHLRTYSDCPTIFTEPSFWE